MKKTLSIIHYSLFILIIITLSFCSNTGPQTGSLSGTVQLEDQSDHSCIVIGIYELAELDPDIVDANQKWPHIGVIINQMTEFDHRFGTLVKTGETDASGYFEIKDIPTGVYNVVAIKDSFGFRYIYNAQINDGNNELSAKNKDKRSKIKSENSTDVLNLSSLVFDLNNRTSDLTLFPETIISSDISTPTTWQSDHHYIIERDIIVDDEITIEPGAVIRLNDRVKLTINGDLTADGRVDNFIWFTSNDSIFSSSVFRFPSPVSLYEYKTIELDGTLNKEVAYCKFDHAGTGLLSKVNGFEISDCIFRESNCGFKAEDVDSTFCSNLLCENITGESEGGIYFGSSVDGGNIKNNVCSNCVNGIKIYNHSNPEVKNNYIVNCNTGIDISYYSSPNIKNNEINFCVIGIKNHLYNESFTIEKNNFNCTIGIKSLSHISNPINVHYNNFNCENYAVSLGSDSFNIYFENNYFYTINEDEIQELIYDKNDVEGPNQQYYGIVNYIPFLTQEYKYAGIEEE